MVTSLVLLAIVALCYALGTQAFFVFVCVVVLVALFEVLDALAGRGQGLSIPLGLAGGLGVLLAAYARRPDLILVAVSATLYCSFLWALRSGRGQTAASDVAWTIAAIAWVAGGGGAAVGILLLPDGLRLLVAFIFIAALFDIAAYFTGTAFGRHKLAPSISPAKSWEGLAGGFAMALAGGLAAALLLPEVDILQGLMLGAVVGVLAPAGDLVESVFKREVGKKDSGNLLPGHGGLLDRLDAIAFAAPAAFLLLHVAVS